MFNTNYLKTFNLFEIWLIIITIVLFFACLKTNILYFLLLILIFPLVAFGFLFCLVSILVLFAPDGFKSHILFSILGFCIKQNFDISIHGPEIPQDAIVISNYPTSFLEYILLPILIPSRQFCIIAGVKTKFWTSLFLDSKNRTILQDKNNFDSLKNFISKSKTIPIIYPEKNFKQRKIDEVTPFRSGIFKIAQQLNKPIYLVKISHFEHVCGFITNPNIKINIKKASQLDPEICKNEMEKM